MRLLAVVTYPNEMEARLAAQRLEAEGIRSVVKPLGAGYGAFGGLAYIHHRVYVDAGDLERAQAMLSTAASPGPPEE